MIKTVLSGLAISALTVIFGIQESCAETYPASEEKFTHHSSAQFRNVHSEETTSIKDNAESSLPGRPQSRIETLKDKVKSIEKEYGVRFVYGSDIDLDRPYTGGRGMAEGSGGSGSIARSEGMAHHGESVSAEGLESALKRVFGGTGISWKVQRRYIVLGLEPPRELRDSIGGHDGSCPGGVTERRDTLAESRITSEHYSREHSRTQTGLTSIDGSRFSRGYAFLSSPDLIKTLQTLPGVASGTELMSGLYVHGGTGSDNLFLLDGVPLYNVSHLAGLFSSFNTDVVESLDFYKSGFPARYGGRLSSVVDVKTREGDFEEYHGLFSIGLIDGRLQYEGPIVRGKTSFNVAIRRSWMDLVMIPGCKILNKRARDGRQVDLRYSFQDMNGKITHRFSDRSRLSLNLYYGHDGLKFKDMQDSDIQEQGDPVLYNTMLTRLKWGNLAASLDWRYRAGKSDDIRVTAYYTRSPGKVLVSSGNWSAMRDWEGESPAYVMAGSDENNVSMVQDFGLKADFGKTVGRVHHFRYGAGYQYHRYSPRREYENYAGDGTERLYTDSDVVKRLYHGHEASLYFEDEMTFSDRFSADVGLRYALYGVQGKVYHSAEPRAALKYSLSSSVALKASYTEMSQFNHSISSLYMDLPTGLVMPSTARVKPMRSRQVAAGVYTSLPYHLHLNVEGFYKTMDNIIEYDGLGILFPPLDQWETSFASGKGRAFGAELDFGYSTGSTEVNLYYTLSWNMRRFDRFYGSWYMDRNDNRHKITVTATHRFSDRLDLYMAWHYHSGNKVTVPDQTITDYSRPSGTIYYYYSRPNNVSLPAYHRLDFGLNIHRKTRRGNESIWNVSFYNAYCRMNAVWATVMEEDNGRIRGYATSLFPIIPSFSYTLKF